MHDLTPWAHETSNVKLMDPRSGPVPIEIRVRVHLRVYIVWRALLLMKPVNRTHVMVVNSSKISFGEVASSLLPSVTLARY